MSLTPELALDYLGELSTDIRGAVVLDRDGALAAGPPDEPERAERMRELVLELLERADAAAAGGRAHQVEVNLAGGSVFALRTEQWSIGVVATRFALSSLMFYDLRSVVSDLGAGA